MRLKSYVFLSSLLFMLCLTGFVENATSKDSNPSLEQLKKEQIIRSINLLRAAQRQPVLTFEGLFKHAQGARLSKMASEGGAIAGTLFGIKDQYIVTASVVAWRSDSDPADSTGSVSAHFGKVDPNGSYRVEDLESGDYYVLALADTYIPKFYNNVTEFSDAITVPVKDGEVTSGVDFRMEQINSGSASLAGKVVTQKDGHPIARAFINVFSPDNPFFYGWTETGADGSYEIVGLKSGSYYAYAWAEGYLSEYYKDAPTFEQATPIQVVDDNRISDINFTLSSGGVISGVVTSINGQPLAGVYVQAYTDYRSDPTNPDSAVVYSYGYAITDNNGSYRIGGLSAASFLVTAQMWNQWFYLIEWFDNVTDISEATPVSVQNEEETPGINFDLDVPTAFGSIFGKVVDSRDEPIAGAVVQAHAPFDQSAGGLQVWAYAYTDNQGNYRIDQLPDGDYLVSAYAQVGWQYVNRYWPDAESPEQAQAVVVYSGPNAPRPGPINFKLPISPGTASISGRVLRTTGEPIVYGYVQLSSEDSSVDPATGVNGGIWAYASTDSFGNYRIDRLPAGKYIAHTQHWEGQSFAQQWFDHKSSRSEATPIVLADGDHREDINFDLTLRPYYGAIAGSVTNEADGRPLHRAYVEITPLGIDYREFAAPLIWPGFVWPYHAITNEQGNYQLEWLPEGEYYVAVYSEGAFEYFENAPVPELAAKVKVIGGETTAVNFALTPRDEGDGVISGKVSDEWNSGALQIAIVIARPRIATLGLLESEQFFNTVTRTDGTYELTGLPAGEYLLFSFAPGYIGEYYDNVFDPEEAKAVTIDENQAVTGIDFTLSPILWLRCPECDVAAPGQMGGGQVFGKVTDGGGNVIRNATIYLLNDSQQPVSFSKTNAEGMYELRSVPPGRYRIKATHANFSGKYNNGVKSFADAQVVEVGNGSLEINFVLDSVTGVDDGPTIPSSIELYGNYPNPFNPETRIKFGLPSEMTVRLRIFNLLGREVRTLDGGRMAAGEHAISWNGRDHSGAVLSSGIYFYMLEVNGQSRAVQKMTLLK
ncbi:MAG TPA: carboxypeptidase regulatory-like domain-containing protein [bacterium]